MTQEPKDVTPVPAQPPEDTFESRADQFLQDEDKLALARYLNAGGKKLAVDTASSFFQLFLNGSDTKEIYRLNKAFPYEAILFERIAGRWDHHKELYLRQLQEGIRDKLLKANLETVGLLTDMLSVANKQHGDKLKKFLQTGNEKDLQGSMSVDSIHQLLKVLEGLHKAVGMDKPKDASIINNIHVTSQSAATVIAPPDAAKTLAAAAAAKRGAK